MEGMKQIPFILLMLAIAGITLGASSVVLSKFGDTVSDPCYNTSYDIDSSGRFCRNATVSDGDVGGAGQENLNLSDSYYSILKGQNAQEDIGEQMPTVGIIAIMAIILSVLAGVFAYINYFK